MALALLEAIDPFLPYRYPVLALFTGLGFPGGASPEHYYMSDVAETWLPFLVTFVIVKILTKRRARFLRALLLYGAFLLWSAAMVWLAERGAPLGTIINFGLAGTFFGGSFLYLWLIDPKRS